MYTCQFTLSFIYTMKGECMVIFSVAGGGMDIGFLYTNKQVSFTKFSFYYATCFRSNMYGDRGGGLILDQVL